ncbi:class F sortase [Streptacidiphilus monticola]|uniref:Class F sortase n=1 Tax=Streptacidiphilus monticola TaxID=2161674 RepID=A0ABW1G417_9ACTN
MHSEPQPSSAGAARTRTRPVLGRRGRVVRAVIAALALVAGWQMFTDGTHGSAPPQPAAVDGIQATGSPRAGASAAVAPGLPPSPPTRIVIPAIQVNAPIIAVGLDASSHLLPPPEDNRNLAGWYKNGPTPGSSGNAVIDGHVDTMQGPAVFWGLGALHKGNIVQVQRADRTTAVFTIDAIEVYSSSDFPSARVYGPTTRPELRLITCGGGYTKKTGYLGNVVVFAHLTGSLRPTS